MKKYGIVMGVILLCLVGCKAKQASHTEGGKESMTQKEYNQDTKEEKGKEQKKESQEIDMFFQLMEEDVVGDEKSVSWDGTQATVIDDVYDSTEISDGRFEMSGREIATVAGVFEFAYPNTLKQVSIKSGQAEDYYLTAENVEIRIQQIEYASEKKNLDENLKYRNIDASSLSEHQTKYFNQYALYMGMVDTDEGCYAGYTLVFESNLAKRSYRISVDGIGNMADIKATAVYVMNHFDVLFE